MSTTSTTIQILLSRFNGRILIPFVEAVTAAGFVEQTARNQIHKGIFPIPTVVNGSKRLVHIEDLANFIDGLRQQNQPKKKTGRGRPTKASQMARLAQAEMGSQP
jgi:hypothetical protein